MPSSARSCRTAASWSNGTVRSRRLEIHSPIARIPRLGLLNPRAPFPVGVFHSWPDLRENHLRDRCPGLRRVGSFAFHHLADVSADDQREAVRRLSPRVPRLLPGGQFAGSLKFNRIVHVSLCSSGGMMSLLMKPGNLARAASCRPFHSAKASSLPGTDLRGGDQDGR